MTWTEVISLFVAPVLAIIVGVVTKLSTPAGIKSVLLLLLSTADGLLAQFMAHPDSFDWKRASLNALAVFITAVGAHYGFLKPTGITEKAQTQIGPTDPVPVMQGGRRRY